MELEINLDESLDITNFCNWLIAKIPYYLLDEIDEKKLVPFDTYINDSDSIKWINNNLKHVISSKDILVAAALNMELLHNKDSYKIRINPSAIIPNTYAKFIDIVSLINYGNLSLFAYPIYDKMMQFFANNIPSLYQTYLEEI